MYKSYTLTKIEFQINNFKLKIQSYMYYFIIGMEEGS